MSEDTRYNGWRNYETWVIALWGGCDDSEQAQGVYDSAECDTHFTRKERAKLDLADTLKEQFEESVPELQGPLADLLNSAVGEVDWHEIAEHALENVEEQAEESEEDAELVEE